MFCKNCGLRLNNGASFCPKCGTKTESNNNNSNELYSQMNNIQGQNNTPNNQNESNWNTTHTELNNNINNNKSHTGTGIPKWLIVVLSLIGIIILYSALSSSFNSKPDKKLSGLWNPTYRSSISYDENNIWYFDETNKVVYNYLNVDKTEYVYGSYVAKKGYEGLKMAGYDKEAYNRLKGNDLKDENIITVKITPYEMVYEGKKETLTGTRYYVWIISDNGIKAEVMACSTGAMYNFIKG